MMPTYRIWICATALLLARASGAQSLDEKIQRELTRFPAVPANTDFAANRLSAVTLNEKAWHAADDRIDGVRFVIPEGPNRELHWAVQFPPNVEDFLGITLGRGDIDHQFSGYFAESFWTTSTDDKTAPAGTRLLYFLVPANKLPPGETCVIWFRFTNDRPARIAVNAIFTRPGFTGSAQILLPALNVTNRPPLRTGELIPPVVVLPLVSANGPDAAFEATAEQLIENSLARREELHVLTGRERQQWLADYGVTNGSEFRGGEPERFRGPGIFVQLGHDSKAGPLNLGISILHSADPGVMNASGEPYKPAGMLVAPRTLTQLGDTVLGYADDLRKTQPDPATRASNLKARRRGPSNVSVAVRIAEKSGIAAQKTAEELLRAAGLRIADESSADYVARGGASAETSFARSGHFASMAHLAVQLKARRDGTIIPLHQSALVAGATESEAAALAIHEAALQVAERIAARVAP